MPSQEREGVVCLFLSSLGLVFFFWWSAEGGLGLVSHLKSKWQHLETLMGKRVWDGVGGGDGMGDGSPWGGMRMQPPWQAAPALTVLPAYPGCW